MKEIINSFLLQHKEPALPGIGYFSRIKEQARVDIVNKKIFPPANEYVFNENLSHDNNDLIEYIARKKNIDKQDAEVQLINYCNDLKQKLRSGEKFCFDNVGCLEKNDSGNILFTGENNSQILIPLIAEKVLHQNVSHTLLVGDKETTTAEMIEYYDAQKNIGSKLKWIYWAIAFSVIGVAALIFHFSNNFSPGNQNHFVVPTPGKTYFLPK